MTHATAVAVLMPVYDDWDAAMQVMTRLRSALGDAHLTIVVVDDASSHPAPPNFTADDVRLIRLRRNLGHQRAICVGLCWIREHLRADTVVVMDADGEDAPEDVQRLLDRYAAHQPPRVTFASRARRSESLLFKVLYNIYRWVHLLLTGIPVRGGNFSVIGASHLERLTVSAELWSHYAASVFKSKLPMDAVPIDRARRISGASRMKFTDLVLHGLAAISVFAETVVVRLFLGLAVFALALVLLLVAVVVVRFFTPLAIPGWATAAFGMLSVLLFQAIGISLVLVMGMLAARQGTSFIPLRDYAVFIDRVTGT